jgi:hypothetical protein
MPMTAYATATIDPGVLAAAVIVMEAYRAQSGNFPAGFAKHPAITATPDGEGFSFTADMRGLMSPVAFGLNRHGGGQAQIISLNTGSPIDEQIAKAIGHTGGPAAPGGFKPGL